MIGHTNTRFANPYLPQNGEVEYAREYRSRVRVLVTSWKVKEGIRTKEISPGYGNGNADVRSPVFSAFSHILYSASTVGLNPNPNPNPCIY